MLDGLLRLITVPWANIFIQVFMTSLIYLLIRYRFKLTGKEDLVLSRKTIKKLILDFAPDPLVPEIIAVPGPFPVKYNFASYDIFNLASRFKEEVKEAIRTYSVGTCGPRGFYGTLDIHNSLEALLSRIFHRPGAILYPNYFTCLQTTIQCFCLNKHTVFFYRHASEPILRGIYASRASSIVFDSLDDLEQKLKNSPPEKYVVIERLCKNTGELFDLKRLVGLKQKYKFRLIMDEAMSVPMLPDIPDKEQLYQEVDLITGALCYGYPGGGGFACGSVEVVEYQRLSSTSYVFSASIPGYLAQAALCFLGVELDHAALAEKVAVARQCLADVVSHEDSPILLVKCEDARKTQRRLAEKGFLTGVNGAYLRVCIGISAEEKQIRELAGLIQHP